MWPRFALTTLSVRLPTGFAQPAVELYLPHRPTKLAGEVYLLPPKEMVTKFEHKKAVVSPLLEVDVGRVFSFLLEYPLP